MELVLHYRILLLFVIINRIRLFFTHIIRCEMVSSDLNENIRHK